MSQQLSSQSSIVQQQQQQQQQSLLFQKLQTKIDQLLVAFTPTTQEDDEESDRSENFQRISCNATAIIIESYLQSVTENDTALIETIVQMTKQVFLRDSNTTLKLQVAKFFKRCVDTWNLFVIARTKQVIIPIFFEALKSALSTTKNAITAAAAATATTTTMTTSVPCCEVAVAHLSSSSSTSTNCTDIPGEPESPITQSRTSEASKYHSQMIESSSQLPQLQLLNLNRSSKNSQNNENDENHLRLLLTECLFIWSKWFTEDKAISSVFTDLLRDGLAQPTTLTFFSEIDILYRDVETLQSNLLDPNAYIFSDECISSKEFLCAKQCRIRSSNLLLRKVQFIDDNLFQIEMKKGTQSTKPISFPDYFFLQGRAEYLQIKGCKVPKSKGIDLKLGWDDPLLEKLEWRLLCKRGLEDRCFAIYFATHQQAAQVKDFIHFTKAKSAVKNVRSIFASLAANFKSTVASKYHQRHIVSNGEFSTSGSLFTEERLGQNTIDTRIEQFLQMNNQ